MHGDVCEAWSEQTHSPLAGTGLRTDISTVFVIT